MSLFIPSGEYSYDSFYKMITQEYPQGVQIQEPTHQKVHDSNASSATYVSSRQMSPLRQSILANCRPNLDARSTAHTAEKARLDDEDELSKAKSEQYRSSS